MATIQDLSTSITKLSYPEIETLVSNIRTIRRTKPERDKKSIAKTCKRPNKKNLKQSDHFAQIKGLSKDARLKILEALLLQEK